MNYRREAMKKIKLLMLAVLLTGCKAEPTQLKESVCTMNENGVAITTNFKHDNEYIKTQKNVNVVQLNMSRVSVDELAAAAEIAADVYRSIKGVEYSYEIDEQFFTETLFIDFETASIQELSSVGIVRNADETTTQIKISETLAKNREMGLDCTSEE